MKKKKLLSDKEWCEANDLAMTWNPVWNGKRMKDLFIITDKHRHVFACHICKKEFIQSGWRDIALHVLSMRLVWSRLHWFCSYECFIKKEDRVLAYFEEVPNLSYIAKQGKIPDAMNVADQYYYGIVHPKKACFTLTRRDVGNLLKEDEDNQYKEIRHIFDVLYTVWPEELIRISLSYHGLSPL